MKDLLQCIERKSAEQLVNICFDNLKYFTEETLEVINIDTILNHIVATQMENLL